MAKKFIETRTTTVTHFKDIYANPNVETENKQEKYRGNFFSQILEMFYLLKPSQLNSLVGTIFQRSSGFILGNFHIHLVFVCGPHCLLFVCSAASCLTEIVTWPWYQSRVFRTLRTTKLVVIIFRIQTEKDGRRIKRNQPDATYYFIVLLIGSTCFKHYYAHHQELATMMLITTLVFSFLVWCIWRLGAVWLV